MSAYKPCLHNVRGVAAVPGCVLVLRGDGRLQRWDPATLVLLATSTARHEAETLVLSEACPDWKVVASVGGSTTSVIVWDAETLVQLHKIEANGHWNPHSSCPRVYADVVVVPGAGVFTFDGQNLVSEAAASDERYLRMQARDTGFVVLHTGRDIEAWRVRGVQKPELAWRSPDPVHERMQMDVGSGDVLWPIRRVLMNGTTGAVRSRVRPSEYEISEPLVTERLPLGPKLRLSLINRPGVRAHALSAPSLFLISNDSMFRVNMTRPSVREYVELALHRAAAALERRRLPVAKAVAEQLPGPLMRAASRRAENSASIAVVMMAAIAWLLLLAGTLRVPMWPILAVLLAFMLPWSLVVWAVNTAAEQRFERPPLSLVLCAILPAMRADRLLGVPATLAYAPLAFQMVVIARKLYEKMEEWLSVQFVQAASFVLTAVGIVVASVASDMRADLVRVYAGGGVLCIAFALPPLYWLTILIARFLRQDALPAALSRAVEEDADEVAVCLAAIIVFSQPFVSATLYLLSVHVLPAVSLHGALIPAVIVLPLYLSFFSNVN